MQKIKGLVSALFTPLKENGDVRYEEFAPMIDSAIESGIMGFYVLGSTGEGLSLSIEERKLVTEEVVRATAGRVPVIVQVGHNSVRESCSLAKHAQACGADAISANAPSYFKVNTVDTLIDCLAEINEGIDLPFYYYHIPALTGAALDMIEFLEKAPARINNLFGLKFSEMDPGKYLQCKRFSDGAFDVLWGCDEHILSALAVGMEGAVGSTYNFMPRLYQSIISSFGNGQYKTASELTLQAYTIVEVLGRYAPIHPVMKFVMRQMGFNVGAHRLPQPKITPEQESRVLAALEKTTFFEWSVKPLKGIHAG